MAAKMTMGDCKPKVEGNEDGEDEEDEEEGGGR